MDYGIYDILTLLGSLGLFLYGMKTMSDALMEVAGDKMRNILATMTSNRVLAVFTGFLITAIIQSSSATTLMVVSFVNASLLTLTEAVGVILGANIGTTITAWLITLLGFKVSMSTIALPLVGIGFLLMFSKKEKTQQWGRFIVGFAILFIGLDFLKSAVPDIKNNPDVLNWLSTYTDLGYGSVFIFLAIGTILTVIIQSSSATMALTLVMCHEGWIPFDMAAAMVLGENVGTTITANLAALVANVHAKRAARAHFISQILGVVWMLILFYPFLNGIDYIANAAGPSAFDSPIAIPTALSAFHTAFNVINMLALIWFVPLIVRIVNRMIPDKPEEIVAVEHTKYLTKGSMDYPQTGMKAMIDESKRLFEGPLFKIVAHVFNIHRTDIKSDTKIKKIVKLSNEVLDIDVNDVYYQKVKHVYGEIFNYAVQMQEKLKLTKEQTKDVSQLRVANRNMVEIIKDCHTLNKNMAGIMNIENEHLRKAYDKMRIKTAKTMRQIYLLDVSENRAKHIKKLENLKDQITKDDLLVDGTISEMIAKNKINPAEATSLANDHYLTKNIIRNLIEVTELLYINSDTLLESYANKKKKD